MTQEDVQNGSAAAKTVTFSAVKPQLFVEAPKANDAVLFYKAAFGAEEVSRAVHPKRKAEQEIPLVLVAELKLGSSSILVSDLVDDSVKTLGSGFAMCLETEDVKAAVAKAVSAGAVSEGELAEGEGEGLVGKLKDPYGFVWTVCSPTKKSVDVEA
ncbi:hypothetical protein RHSIM_Rhsim01G0248500 [Rhododendron simsii]|uniref:VOC domain-containing protein n=1 Tax=Rhododendron simsii TaxID=118357 RepID=A0A834HKM6_RHOSS|nr:hypothetical protein RHSIM_Rhsim01G0248500 [Rhododendron simsii]